MNALWLTFVLTHSATSFDFPLSRGTRSVRLWNGGKGFGKQPVAKEIKQIPRLDDDSGEPTASVDIAPPINLDVSISPVSLEDNLSKEERQAAILRSFGLGKMEERGEPAGGFSTAPNSKSNEREEQASLLSLVPGEVQRAIESLLVFTTGALFLSFLLAGIAITWDAYVIATKTSLPDSLVGIFGVIEPNFTNIGISFLASSSSLGVFKIAQLSNPGAVYSEINDLEEDGR
mmetsp:Transcript_18475/g.36523  ORF Transcript_18475/g.36523 Transcript_18475/m.36523 type:complete len:232 (-) Transcript_18475:293-988(-)